MSRRSRAVPVCPVGARSLSRAATLVLVSAVVAVIPSPLASQAPAPGSLAPEVDLRTLEGIRARLSEFRGRPVLLNFWASWCDPCRVEMPAIVAAYEEHRHAGLEVLAINLRDQERERDVRRFANDFFLPFPVLLDARGKARRAYRLRAIPTSVFVDTAGTVRVVHAGPLTPEALRRGLVQILPRP